MIGRNEGGRLRRCLESVRRDGVCVVYVDSGSTDGSVPMAKGMGVDVVALDMSRAFTAARARNTGLDRLVELRPGVQFVQFVDGDCELASGWLEAAARELSDRKELAAVAGRLRERERGASLYNRLCDMEWDGVAGEVKACGGICMMRVQAVRQVGGFNPDMIAGEEPELCVRLRLAGWKVWRLGIDMGWHDAAMRRFGQWWKRAVRAGHAYTEGASMHGRGPLRHNVSHVRSARVWGLAVPALIVAAVAAAVAGVAWVWLAAVVLAAGYPALGWKIYKGRRRDGEASGDAVLYAVFCVLAKFAHVVGMGRYWWNRVRGRRATLIEYKTPVASDPTRA